jgi:hypothetical protein
LLEKSQLETRIPESNAGWPVSSKTVPVPQGSQDTGMGLFNLMRKRTLHLYGQPDIVCGMLGNGIPAISPLPVTSNDVCRYQANGNKTEDFFLNLSPVTTYVIQSLDDLLKCCQNNSETELYIMFQEPTDHGG